jgi:hypothetical protein
MDHVDPESCSCRVWGGGAAQRGSQDFLAYNMDEFFKKKKRCIHVLMCGQLFNDMDSLSN